MYCCYHLSWSIVIILACYLLSIYRHLYYGAISFLIYRGSYRASTCQCYRHHILPAVANVSSIILLYLSCQSNRINIVLSFVHHIGFTFLISLVNLSYLYCAIICWSITLYFLAISCQCIVLILLYQLLVYHHHITLSVVNLSYIKLWYHLLIYRLYFLRYLLSIYRICIVLSFLDLLALLSCYLLSIFLHCITVSVSYLSSSYCASTGQSIVIILCQHWSIYRHHIALSLVSLSSFILCYHLVNLSSSYCAVTCQCYRIYIMLSFVNLLVFTLLLLAAQCIVIVLLPPLLNVSSSYCASTWQCIVFILRYRLSTYRHHTCVLSLVNLSYLYIAIICWSIGFTFLLSLVSLSYLYCAIICWTIGFTFLLSVANVLSSYCSISLVNLSSSYCAISCQSIVFILCYHLLIYWLYFLAISCQVYRPHIALSVVNLSSSYCAISCQSIVNMLRSQLSIYRHHIALSLVESIVFILCNNL